MKKVICIETNEVFKSATEAAKAYGTERTNVAKVCRGVIGSTKGKTFRYIDEHNNTLAIPEAPVTIHEIEVAKPSIVKGKGRRHSGNTNAVFCISTGEIYSSGVDAAEQNDMSQATMSYACRGKGRSAKGKQYCYTKDIVEHLDIIADSIRKATMYDELMTKEEKRSELLSEVHKWEDEILNIESAIANLQADLDEAHKRLEEAKYNVINFN